MLKDKGNKINGNNRKISYTRSFCCKPRLELGVRINIIIIMSTHWSTHLQDTPLYSLSAVMIVVAWAPIAA